MLVALNLIVTLLLSGMLANGMLNMRRVSRRQRALRHLQLPARPPLISVCVPARNEARNIATCLESLARQDYPNYEVLVLDDCSEDDTGRIADRIAARHRRIRVFPGRPLPPGWIGKPHACHQLARHARGEYLLFTDADTEFSPRALREAYLLASARRADLLSGLPHMKIHTIWERLSVPMLGAHAIGCMPFGLLERAPLHLFAAASGAFLFFRREAYEALGGHQLLRGHIVEDIAFARELKRKGGNLILHDISGWIRCRMYTCLPEVWEGFTKNFNAAFPNGLVLGAIGFLLACYVWPWAAFLLGPSAGLGFIHATAFPLAQLTATLLFRAVVDRRLGYADLPAMLLIPASAIFLSLIGLASWSRAVRRKPTPWRNRHYSLWEKTAHGHNEPTVSDP